MTNDDEFEKWLTQEINNNNLKNSETDMVRGGARYFCLQAILNKYQSLKPILQERGRDKFLAQEIIRAIQVKEMVAPDFLVLIVREAVLNWLEGEEKRIGKLLEKETIERKREELVLSLFYVREQKANQKSKVQ